MKNFKLLQKKIAGFNHNNALHFVSPSPLALSPLAPSPLALSPFAPHKVNRYNYPATKTFSFFKYPYLRLF